MKILVTGANGYLGSGIVKRLLDLGHTVIAADLDNRFVDNRAIFVRGDIFQVDDPFSTYFKPDCVLHLAWRNGFSHFDRSHIDDLPKHSSFLQKMIMSGVGKVSVMGSMHEIGFFEGCINEFTPCFPQNLYGIAKNALREITRLDCEKAQVDYQWLRAFYIVGTSTNGCSVFSKIVQAHQNGQTVFPFVSGQKKYDFLDYDLFCKYVCAAVVQKEINGIINICSGRAEAIGLRAESFIAQNKLNIKLRYGAFPDRPYDSDEIWGDNAKLSAILEADPGSVL